MRIVNNHIVEDMFGLLFCGEYFDNEPVTETDSFNGICARCAKQYRSSMALASKHLESLSYSHKMFFNRGKPYIYDTHKQKRIDISHKSLDFLEKQEFIVGWYGGEFSGNPEINCVLTSKGRDYIRKHRRI